MANWGSLDWAIVDTVLYNKVFEDYPQVPVLPGGHSLLTGVCSCSLGEGQSQPGEGQNGQVPSWQLQSSSTPHSDSIEICCLFNVPARNRCRLQERRYAHLCKRPHPLANCGKKRPGGQLRSPAQLSPLQASMTV